MPIRGIIFDLDGVICSTDRYHFMAWSAVCRLHSVPFSEEVNDMLRGVSRAESLEIILRKAGRTMEQGEKDAFLKEKNDRYRLFLEGMDRSDFSEEVSSTLDILRTRFKIAIGSSSRNTPLILERLGLDDFFDAVADGSMIKKSKPDPEVFLLAADKLGLDPSECLVVEDAESGADAGKRGGFKVAGLGPASRYEVTDYQLGTFSDLLMLAERI